MSQDHKGVLYSEAEYAGFLKRVLIQVVDFIICLIMLAPCLLADSYRYENYNSDDFLFFTYLGVVFCVVYMTFVKASKYGTVGQLLTSTEIRTIEGKKPNFFQMIFRLMFWVVGPFNFLADFAFIHMNYEKRTLRDCLCNTILVKKGSVPTSSGLKLKYVRAMFFAFHILYKTPEKA